MKTYIMNLNILQLHICSEDVYLAHLKYINGRKVKEKKFWKFHI